MAELQPTAAAQHAIAGTPEYVEGLPYVIRVYEEPDFGHRANPDIRVVTEDQRQFLQRQEWQRTFTEQPGDVRHVSEALLVLGPVVAPDSFVAPKGWVSNAQRLKVAVEEGDEPLGRAVQVIDIHVRAPASPRLHRALVGSKTGLEKKPVFAREHAPATRQSGVAPILHGGAAIACDRATCRERNEPLLELADRAPHACGMTMEPRADGTLMHRAGRTSAPVQIVLISAASRAGKTFVLRRLATSPSFADVDTFEMDSAQYWKPELLEAGIVRIRDWFEEWLRAEAPSPLVEDIADDVRRSSPVHQILKMKLVELATGAVPVVTVNPEATRYDPGATRFLRKLEEHCRIRIRHVLLHPTIGRYLLNLIRSPLAERGWTTERSRLYARRREFDGVLRIGLVYRERTVERFFREQMR